MVVYGNRGGRDGRRVNRLGDVSLGDTPVGLGESCVGLCSVGMPSTRRVSPALQQILVKSKYFASQAWATPALESVGVTTRWGVLQVLPWCGVAGRRSQTYHRAGVRP